MEYMKSFFKKIKWESLLTALFTIIVGIVFLCEPENSGNVLCIVAGVSFLVLGAALFVRYFASGFLFGTTFLASSVILIATGIFSLARPDVFMTVITFIFGIFLILDGILKIQDGVDCLRANVRAWWLLFIVAALSITLGFIIMFDSFDSIMVIAGISLIIDGVFDIITTLMFSSHVRKIEKRVRNVVHDVIENEEE